MGLIFALIAMLAWGGGDFLIQRSVRSVAGEVKFSLKRFFRRLIGRDEAKSYANLIVLSYIVLVGAIVLLPFIVGDLAAVLREKSYGKWALLLGASIAILIASLFDFQALRIGKLSVIEPILAFEIPITALAAFIFIKERLTLEQVFLVIIIFVGILLISVRSFQDFKVKNLKLEKGVVFAVLATLVFGLTNFLVGLSSRETSPLLINWFLNVFIFLSIIIFLFFKSKVKVLLSGCVKEYKKLILATAVVNNVAWIAYAYSVLYLPIAIAIGITESYIALAAVLGLIVNKEKLKIHQSVGLAVTVSSAIILAISI